MSDLAQHIADLSPEKRRLLEQMLQKKGVKLADAMIVPQQRDGRRLPLSFAQQRLWFLYQFDPASPMYNIPMLFEIEGNIQLEPLQRSFATIVARHEILRTTFHEEGGTPFQVVGDPFVPDIPVVDLRRGQGQDEAKAEGIRLAGGEAREPFDLEAGPLLRIRLYRTGETTYLVMLCMHHIIADGWSMGIVVSEFAKEYSALLTGASSPLPPLSLQYADYAIWQREWLKGERLDTQLAYWKGRLGDAPPRLELPTTMPRPARESGQGACVSITVPPALTRRLHDLSRGEDVTMFMTLVAAFQTLLFRYSGQTDISIGTPVAGRSRKEIEGLIGFFVNTLVLRGDLSGSPSFRELLRRVRGTSLDAFAHQDIPFEMLVEHLQPSRDLGSTPLFQAMFALQNAPQRSVALPGLEIRPLQLEKGTSMFDLTLSMTEEGGALEGTLEYRSDIFRHSSAAGLLDHFVMLLEGIVASPDTPITALPLLTEPEYHRIVNEWNATAAEFPEKRLCLHEWFERQVEATPDACAVVFGEHRLTYAQVNERANRLARYLQRQGIGPETLVGLYLERSLDMLVGILGVMKSGGGYVPLDPSYPADRLAYMVADSGTTTIVTHDLLHDSVPATDAHVINMDRERAQIENENPSNPSCGAGAGTMVYIIYTSGSTGRPKGVMVEHRGLSSLIYASLRTWPLHPGDQALQFSSYGFDASVLEIFSALLAGATLHLLPREVVMSPEDLHSYLQSRRIQLALISPSMLSVLPSANLPDLQRVITGGDSCSWDVVERWAAGRRIWDAYGPTETTVAVTWNEVTVRRDDALSPPIGFPIANTTTYVLDSFLNPVPVGVPGELYIGGMCVVRGYIGRPDVTAERFVPDPFSVIPGSRLYRSGDQVRHLEDGSIEFLGRMDHQVKIRGFRVELGEIESELVGHPAVSRALVVLREDVPGQKQLVGYVVFAPGAQPRSEELREHLKKRLPEYMIPSVFVELKDFPLAPTGKINRRALPAPTGTTRVELAEAFVAPRTPTEEELARIWISILGLDRVGVHDNFFSLGGHSLLATQLLSRIRDAFQVKLTLRTVFEGPTIAELARTVEREQQGQPTPFSPPLVSMPRSGDLPLSFAQERLWFLHQLEPESSAYNLPVAFRLQGELDVDALTASVNSIIARHEILRTVFGNVDGKAVARILPSLTFAFRTEDLRPVAAGLREEMTARLLRDEAGRPFDLDVGPLFRGLLIRQTPLEWTVLLTMHHIISDGWSHQVFLRELAALYAMHAGEAHELLQPLALQYVDYALWQRQWLHGEILDRELEYWAGQLQDVPPLLTLPTDRPRPPVQSSRGALQPLMLDPESVERLRALGASEGATPFMTVMAAYQALLAHLSGMEDICVGTPIANRQRSEIEGLIGFFANTVVIRTRLDDAVTFRELLRRVRATVLEANAHQDVPFEKVVERLQPVRDLGHTPLFQAMLVVHPASREAAKLPRLSMESIPLSFGTSNFDLTCVLEETREGLKGGWEYNTDLFDASSIERFSLAFSSLLRSVTQHPDTPVLALSACSPEERETILVTWNATHEPFPEHEVVHRLVDARAALTPDAPAIAGDGTSLSYATLVRKANTLAHLLRSEGIGPEDLVGLSVDRSPAMIVGLLGILKAGGAFLPLDPAYPPDRIGFMVQDSGVKLVITQESYAARFREQNVRLVYLDSDAEHIAAESSGGPNVHLEPENAAYVIYTSGSTGRPKGVMVSHRSLVNHNTAIVKMFGLHQGDRVLQFSSVNFDAALEEIFPALISGATLVVRRDDLLRTGSEFTRLIAEEEITIVDLPTAFWGEWVRDMAEAGTRPPRGVRLVAIGGEKVSAERFRMWSSLDVAHVRWLNTYGPTEATIIATAFEEEPSSAADDTPRDVPIGRPIANATVYVLNRRGDPVMPGVHGEIYVGGAGVARGYLGRPELTAEKFLPDPFSQIPGSRMYRTGDLGCYRHDGQIRITGRADHQVKIRGFRVEPGEVESALRNHPHVQEAVVIATDDGAEGHRLIAYCVPAQEAHSTGSELRQYLQDQLPAYLVPSFVVWIDAVPLTPGGKLDRRALPSPEQTNLDREARYAPPLTPAERILADIWQEILRIPRVGVHDNFFELGGDSILSIQVVSRANRAGLNLTPRQMFQYPTIAELARASGTAQERTAEQGRVTGAVNLTPIQHWFLNLDLPDAHHWNQSILLELNAPMEAEVLKKVLWHILDHHDALRLRFERSAEGWRQTNTDMDDDVPFAVIDLSTVPAPDRSAALERHCDHLQTTLDFVRGPLIRMVLFRMGDGEPDRVLTTIHHLAVDGVSWRILVEDFEIAHGQISRGLPVQLPPKSTSFQQWTHRLAEYAGTPDLRHHVDAWEELLHTPVLPLPVDRKVEHPTVDSADVVQVVLGEEETRTILQEIHGAYGTEINDILLTALALAVQRWTGSSALLVDLENHGREDLGPDVDVSRTVGWFTTVFPVRLDVSRMRNIGEAIRAVKEQMRALPGKGFTFQLLKYLSPDAAVRERLARLAQPQMSFNYLGQIRRANLEVRPFSPGRESTGRNHSPRGTMHYLLDINGGVTGDRLGFDWTYSKDIYDRSTVERVAAYFADSLRIVREHCLSPEVGGYTPSDFMLANLNQKSLDGVLRQLSRHKEKKGR
jgi:amino acid adenylation domain-containing protein/non-ribosomal peptide synthase protein (TIGR01720 family)